jgi:predicted ATPase/DNA-binding SARP family transcriptional activator
MEFRILGPLEAREDGVALALGGAKQRALLAVLLLHANEVVSTEELIAALWETPPARPAKAVQVYASRLRRALGRSMPKGRTPGYVVEVQPDQLDLERFRQLREEAQRNPSRAAEKLHEALSLWRGTALAEFEREPFARAERLRLEELRLEALEERIEAELAVGAHARLVPELEAFVAAQPMRERLRGQLMVALYRSGRQEEALAAYRDARRTLVDELGIEPGRALQDLEQAILRQDPALELPQAGPMAGAALELPSGTVTFLCTDVEGSTALLTELGADVYAGVLEKHRAVLREAFVEHRGVEVDTQGDSFLVAFGRATDAVSAASAAQQRLADGPLHIRMGLHTGEPLRTSEGYAGLVVHTTARICAAGHGGQVLLSQATRDLAEVEAKDLGLHRLKDLDAPVRIYQLGHAESPPLGSRFFSNLPVPATPFLGREHEVEQVVGLLCRDDAHLVTLVGPGGTGKTRLAIEAAAEAPERFPDGITWIPLAPLEDPALVLSTVAHSVGISDTAEAPLAERLTNALASRRTLLLLDNLEHLLPRAAADVALLAGAGTTVVLATSRERLQLEGERVYSVPTMTEDEAVELFRTRADALGADVGADGEVTEICARLDRLPLALELAAARMTLFTPEQLVERLGQRLDLLKGGRDADARQRTLRATIEWSHDLLDEQEQRLFRQLSIFADGCTYEAAEEVCAAAPDTLQSLIDKSLLRRREGEFGPRYWMLETIREYAAGRLGEAGEEDTAAKRHASWVCGLAEELVGMISLERHFGDPVGAFPEELANARRALAWAWETNELDLALRLGPACFRFWLRRGFYRDALSWLEQSLPVSIGATPVGLNALRAQGLIAFTVLGDPELAGRRWTEAAALARQLGKEDELEMIESGLAAVVWARGDPEHALKLSQDGLARARARGHRRLEVSFLHGIGLMFGEMERFDDADRAHLQRDAIRREIGDPEGADYVHSRGDVALDREDLEAAAELYLNALEPDRETGVGASPRLKAYCLAGLACVLAEVGQDDVAARLWGAVSAAEENLGFRIVPHERRRYERRVARFENTDGWVVGRELTLEEAEALVAPALAAAGL